VVLRSADGLAIERIAAETGVALMTVRLWRDRYVQRGLSQTHDYTRHGTTCLFAALEVGSGRMTHETRERHTGADFQAFLRGASLSRGRAAHRARQRASRSSSP
jgi:hypothetical protein